MILRLARGPALLAIAAVFGLAGCGVHVTTKAADPTPSGTSTALPTTASPSGGTSTAPPTAANPPSGTSTARPATASPSGADLETACRTAAGAANETISEVFDHPNDFVAAARIYAKGAKTLRDIGAGRPIETEVNRLAMAMESLSAELARGIDNKDNRDLAPAAQALADKCGIR
jgi:hypothetical protein